MPKKIRPSVQKREREQKKRQRNARKAETAALKRARREGNMASRARTSSTEEIEGNRAAADPPPETDD